MPRSKKPKPHAQGPYNLNVVQLAHALANGDDCAFALHDALCENGHHDLATHFKDGKACHAGKDCPLLKELVTQGEFARVPKPIQDRWGRNCRIGEALHLCLQLHLAGIALAEMAFSGMEDSGTVESVTLYRPDGKALPTNDRRHPEFDDALEDLCCEFLPDGWEINEGASGTYTVFPVACVGRLNYTSNVYVEWDPDTEDRPAEDRVPGDTETREMDYRKEVTKLKKSQARKA
jgi:hypothetical protein